MCFLHESHGPLWTRTRTAYPARLLKHPTKMLSMAQKPLRAANSGTHGVVQISKERTRGPYIKGASGVFVFTLHFQRICQVSLEQKKPECSCLSHRCPHLTALTVRLTPAFSTVKLFPFALECLERFLGIPVTVLLLTGSCLVILTTIANS